MSSAPWGRPTVREITNATIALSGDVEPALVGRVLERAWCGVRLGLRGQVHLGDSDAHPKTGV
jgi:hypothetical protein